MLLQLGSIDPTRTPLSQQAWQHTLWMVLCQQDGCCATRHQVMVLAKSVLDVLQQAILCCSSMYTCSCKLAQQHTCQTYPIATNVKTQVLLRTCSL